MKKGAYDILGIGAPLCDQIIHIPEEYLSGLQAKKGEMKVIDHAALMQILQTIPPQSYMLPILFPGGSATNVIRGLAKLRHKCALLGNIGTDAAGEMLTEALGTLGIIPLYTRSSTPTGQVICLITPDGERTFRSFLGASNEIDFNKISPELFENVSLVHIEGYTLAHAQLTEHAMQYAKKSKALVSFDLSNFEIVKAYQPQIFQLLKQYVDIVFCNAAEAQALMGLPPKAGCAKLKELCHTAVVSMNKDGCWIGQGETLMHAEAFPVAPLDSTGAGDLFASGFLHGFLQGQTLIESARTGALIAASVVQVHGTTLPDATWKSLLEAIDTY